MIKSPVLLAVILLLLTLGAVGYQVYELNRLRLENVSAIAEPLQPPQEGAPSNEKKPPSLAVLASLNLMGSAYKPVEKTTVETLAPISALKLVLIGTIVKKNTDQSSALIQRSNRETKRYFIGDVIEGGVVLSSVAVDQVILKRDDASEVLRYPQGPSSPVASSGSPNMSVAPTPSYVPPATASSASSFPQSAAIAQQAMQNDPAAMAAAAAAQQKAQQIGGSRRMMKIRERLKLPAPAPVPTPAPAPANDDTQTAPSADGQQDTN